MSRSTPRYISVGFLGISAGLFPALAFAQETPGVTNVPQTPPPTGLQAPLPAPTRPPEKFDKPLRTSPDLKTALGNKEVRPLTIEDTIAVALVTNRALATAGASLLRAQGRAEEARAAFNPTLNSTLTYLRLNQGVAFELGAQRITIVNETQRQIGVQATLPLDISGMLRAANDQARFGEIATRLDINRLRNQIVLDVKTAFYDVLRAQALVAVATENLQNSLLRLQDAEKKFQAGTVARFDVIRAQTDVANAQQQLIQARNTVSLSIAALNNVIGINVNTPLQITSENAVEMPPGVTMPQQPMLQKETKPNPPGPNAGKEEIENHIKVHSAVVSEELIKSASSLLQDSGEQPKATQQPLMKVAFDPLDLGLEYQRLVKESLETRPEIWQAQANIQASKKGFQLARRSILPSMALNWGLNYTPDAAGFAPLITTWQATAQIALPIFDGGAARARMRQAKADIASAEVGLRQTEDLVTLEVRQAYLTLVQARDRVVVTTQALAQAQEAFRLARVRYNAGVSQAGISPLLEVSDAQTALTAAQTNQVNALYDYNNARARLDRAIGRYSFVLNGPGYTAPPARLLEEKKGKEKN
jgi:outer membrane protein TolC